MFARGGKMKKIPLRKCVITGEQHPKMEMFRVVRDQEGNVTIDLTGKARGHGAYVSKSEKAIMDAKKKKSLDYHLDVKVPEQIYDDLLAMLKK